MINLQLCFPRSLLVGFVLLTQVNQSCVFPSSAQASIWELIVQSFAGGESGAERTSREVEGLLAQVAKVESLKIDRLYPETPNTVPDWQPLPGMKRLDQRRVHRFLSPDRPETTIQFPRRELTNPSCFHLSTDGRRFYLVQKGRLETWDTQTGKLVDSVKCRMDKPIGIIVSDDQSQIWIFDQVELLSNSEGASKTCEKLSLPHIQKIVRSAQANIFIAVQNDGNLLYLNLENRAILKLDGPPTLDGRVAISPDGKRLLSVCPEGLVTWYIDEPAKAIVTMNLSTDVEANTQTPAAGNTIFAWSSPHAIHAYESGKYLALWKDEKFPSYWNVLQSHIFIGRDEGGYEWPVVVGTHVAADNRLQRVLIDCNLRQGRVYSSSPLFLCDTPIERIELGLVSKSLAFLDEMNLTVMTRTEWSDPLGWDLLDLFTNLIYDGRFEMLESILHDLRRRNFPEKWMTGEQFYSLALEKTARVAAYIENNPRERVCREAYPALKTWLLSESETSKIVRLICAQNTAWDFRGNGYARDLTNAQNEGFEKKMHRAKLILDTFPESASTPFDVYLRRQSIERNEIVDQSDYPFSLSQAMKQYSNELGIHVVPMRDCLPRWYGNPGDCAKYVNLVIHQYPEELRETVYALLATQQFENIGAKVFAKSESNLDPERTLAAVPAMIDEKQIDQATTEALIEIALQANRIRIATRLADYHLEMFTFLSRSAYRNQVLCFVMKHKDNRCKELGLVE